MDAEHQVPDDVPQDVETAARLQVAEQMIGRMVIEQAVMRDVLARLQRELAQETDRAAQLERALEVAAGKTTNGKAPARVEKV